MPSETTKLNQIMKTKQLFRTAMVAICAIALFSVTGCKEKNNPDQPTTPDTKPVSAFASFSFTIDEATLPYFDFTLKYVDKEGKVQTETLAEKITQKRIESALPAKFGFHVDIQLKEGVDLSSVDKVKLAYRHLYESSALTKEGTRVGRYILSENGSSQTWSSSKIEAVLAAYAKSPIEFFVEYDADGNSKEGDWE